MTLSVGTFFTAPVRVLRLTGKPTLTDWPGRRTLWTVQDEPGQDQEGWRPSIHGLRDPVDDPAIVDQVFEPPPSPTGVLDVGPAGVWYSERIDPDWVAAYRLVPEGGSPVVAEVRVFPYEPGQSFGCWSGVVAPRGGVPARVLRKVGVRIPLTKLTKRDRRMVLEAWPAAGRKLGIDPHLARRVRPSRTVTPAFLAMVAQAYIEAHAENPRSPYPDAARRLGYSERYVKDLVRRARLDGYLTATTRGRSGGSLTPMALAALSDRSAE